MIRVLVALLHIFFQFFARFEPNTAVKKIRGIEQDAITPKTLLKTGIFIEVLFLS